jgi:hypothetical protein
MHADTDADKVPSYLTTRLASPGLACSWHLPIPMTHNKSHNSQPKSLTIDLQVQVQSSLRPPSFHTYLFAGFAAGIEWCACGFTLAWLDGSMVVRTCF